MKNILIEIKSTDAHEIERLILDLNNSKLVSIDSNYKPVVIKRKKNKTDSFENTVLIKGTTYENEFNKIEEFPFIYKVWLDDEIKLDCSCNGSRKGTLDDVAECIGAKKLWGKRL
ncbi:MAG: hypothetical protein WDN26_16805 [Chitinophagaceae bacterium]